MKRAPLKRTKSKRPISPTQMLDLQQRVMLRDGACIAAGLDDTICDPHTDAAHVVPQVRLKHFYPVGHPIFRDDRNVVALCRSHHGLMDRGFLRLPEELHPIGFPAFLREFGLDAEYDAMIARRVG